jgi:hypothetical protein
MQRKSWAVLVLMLVSILASCREKPATATADARLEAFTNVHKPLLTELTNESASVGFQQALNSKPACKGGKVPSKVTYHKQDTNTWCWAAAGQMVLETFGKNVSQCQQVNDACEVRNLACEPLDCCAATVPKDCYIGGWPDLKKYGVPFVEHPGALSPAEIVEELGCQARPFLFAWKDPGAKTGHMLVAIDFFINAKGEDIVVAHDPDSRQNLELKYIDYVNGTYQHWNDYYQLGVQQ